MKYWLAEIWALKYCMACKLCILLSLFMWGMGLMNGMTYRRAVNFLEKIFVTSERGMRYCGCKFLGKNICDK